MIYSRQYLGLTGYGSLSGYRAQVATIRSESSSRLENLTGPRDPHPEQFTYRSSTAHEDRPSLRRGWILGRNPNAPESGFETLLWRAENKGHQNAPSSPLGIHGREEVGDVDDFLFEENRPSINVLSSPSGCDDGFSEDDELKLEDRDKCPTKPAYVRGPRVDKKSFIRVYYVSALRVPSAESWELAYELKKFLLNWPKINNIGRVAGDDVDPDLQTLLAPTEKRTTELRAAVRAAAFEVPEPNVIRPLRGKSHSKQNVRGGRLKEEVQSTVLELATAGYDADEERRSAGAAQDSFFSPNLAKKWTGPMRLLLLNEEYAGEQIDALPVPLQAVCSKFGEGPSTNAKVLVNCRLTIFYEYWSMDEVLWELLPEEARFPVKFSRVGHVAELQLHRKQVPFRHLIAQVTLDKNKPTVRSVVFKRIILQGKQYVVQVELLAGTSALVTTGWEHGVPFRVNMASVIWDARLSSERQRLLGQFLKADVLCDVCAGVGLVAIPASLKVRWVYANDGNPDAYNCLVKNAVDNKVSGRIEISSKDIRSFLSSIFYLERPLPITQLLMSHPVDAEKFLGLFRCAFDRTTWPCRSLPRVHLYSISREADPDSEFCKKVANILHIPTVNILTRRVAEEATGGWMMYASFVLPDNFGFRN